MKCQFDTRQAGWVIALGWLDQMATQVIYTCGECAIGIASGTLVIDTKQYDEVLFREL